MRLDVYSPSSTETNDVKRSGAVAPQRTTPPASGHEVTSGPGLKERTEVSHMGQLMRELHGIKTDNPEGFAHVTANISHELRLLATEHPTDNAERLMAMAERFDRASIRGDLSPFRSNPQPYGQVLRGPWAYRQNNDLQEVGPDVQDVIGRVLSAYAQTYSVPPNSNETSNAAAVTDQ